MSMKSRHVGRSYRRWRRSIPNLTASVVARKLGITAKLYCRFESGVVDLPRAVIRDLERYREDTERERQARWLNRSFPRMIGP